MKNRIYILWVLILLVIILWIIYPLLMPYFLKQENSRALFGDSYGALNTLFSGFAFAVLIYTIIQQNIQLDMQREELALQRKELELNRVELSRSAAAQESTEKSIRNQAKLMEYSSRLDGLRTLLQTYSDKAQSKTFDFIAKQNYQTKANEIEQEIVKLTKDLSKILE